jgi:hypothetical protein
MACFITGSMVLWEDIKIVSQSRVNGIMRDMQSVVNYYWLYGGKGFINLTLMKAVYHGPARVTPVQRQSNNYIASPRVSIE